MKKPKKGLYCSKCEGLITIAKKGKKRYFICDNCGVIAHNPLPLLGVGARIVGGAIANRFMKKSGIPKQAREEITEGVRDIIFDNKDIPNNLKLIEKALEK